MFTLLTNLRVRADCNYHMHANLAYTMALPVTCTEGRKQCRLKLLLQARSSQICVLPENLRRMKLWRDPTIQWWALT
jgi:hypothetical protein